MELHCRKCVTWTLRGVCVSKLYIIILILQYYSSHPSRPYSVGTVGIVELLIEFTYVSTSPCPRACHPLLTPQVRCAGDDLDQSLSENVARFAGSLCQQQGMSARAGKVNHYQVLLPDA